MSIEDDLISAVRQRRARDVQRALLVGADPDTRNPQGIPALLIAVENDDLATARALLSYGADPDARWQPPPESPDPEVLAMFDDGPDAGREGYLQSCRVPDEVDVYWECLSDGMARLLVGAGLDPAGFDIYANDECFFPAAVGADRITPITVTREDFQAHSNPRPGRTNPEEHLPAFWSEQIRTCRTAYDAERTIMGKTATTGGPVWSFARYGRSATRLDDGSWLLVAGEHEDSYDDDFAIYADVTVISPAGTARHFIYPEDVFPPTDFHSASLIKDTLWLVGNLGYMAGGAVHVRFCPWTPGPSPSPATNRPETIRAGSISTRHLSRAPGSR